LPIVCAFNIANATFDSVITPGISLNLDIYLSH
jgi:hypothetical protein